jgi:uncharacterized membrane protein
MDYIDFLIVIASASMHAGWNFFAKTSRACKIATLWLGWLIAGFITLPFAIFITDFSGFNSSWIFLFSLTIIAHAFYIYLLGMAYSIGDMSLIYPISRGVAIFCTVCVFIICGVEDVSSMGMMGILMLLLGITLIAFKRLRDLEKRNVLIVAAKTGLCISIYTIIDKFSIEQIPPTFYMSLMFVLTPIFLTPFIFAKYSAQLKYVIKKNKIYSGCIGLVGFTTYLMIMFVLTRNTASYVVALREVSMVFGSVLGIIVLKEEVCIRKCLGIVVIVIGAYLIKIA